MDIIKNTLYISIRHLRDSTIKYIRQSCGIETSDNNELYITLDDVERYFNNEDMRNLNDLRAIVDFAKFMKCDSIHLSQQGHTLSFLTHYQNYRAIELAYYGNGLMYKRESNCE